MAVELATAYISLVPSARGISDKIRAELGGPLEDEGRRSGDNVSSAFGGRFVAGMATVAAAGAAALGAAFAGLAAVGGQFDDAFDTIRVGTGATGEALATLQQDFRDVVRDVPTDFGSASQAIADLNQRLGLTGQPLQAMAEQALNLARVTGTDLGANIEATTRLLGDWSIGNEQAAGALDAVFRASQATGPSVEQLSRLMVQFGAPMRQLGFSFEETAALMGSFEQAGVNTELVMGSMRQALGRMARDGEPAVETFRRVTEEIANAGSASEANALALELFGARAGPDMAAAIREGRFEVADLVNTIANGSETINGAAQDTDDWAESWQRVKNQVLLALEPAATAVFNAIGDAMDRLLPLIDSHLVPGFQRLGAWWTENGPTIIAAAQGFGEMVGGAFTRIGDAIAAVQSWWQGLFGAEGTAVGEMTAFTTNLQAWGEQLLAIFSSAWDAIRAAFDVALTLLRAGWQLFGDDIMVAVQAVWAGIQTIISGFLDAIQGLWEFWAGVFTGDWQRAWDGVQQLFSGVWEQIRGVFQMVTGLIQAQLGMFVQVFQDAWSGFTGWVSSTWDSAWQAVRDLFATAWAAVQGAVSNGITWVTDQWNAMTSTIRGAWDGLWSGVLAAFDTLWGGIRGSFDLAVAGLRGVWDGLTSGIRTAWDGLWTGIAVAFTGVRTGLETLVSGLVGALGTIWNGIRNTLAAPVNWVAEHVINGLIGAVNTVANALGAGSILSPLAVPLIPTFHEGGVVGRGGRMTRLGPLGPGERLIKARDGEEVLPASHPRHGDNYEDEALPPVTGWRPTGFAAASMEDFTGGSASAGMASTIEQTVDDALAAARRLIAETARPILDGLLSMASGAADRFGPPGRIVAAAGRTLVEQALAWISGVDEQVAAEQGRRVPGPGAGWQAMMDWLHRSYGPVTLFSGPRPGAITATGGVSYHGRPNNTGGIGRAVDIDPSAALFEHIYSHAKDRSAEIIFSPMNDRQVWHGQHHMFSGVTRANHWDHIHWALANGGLVKATPGGTRTILGEGGSDELVIPLDRFLKTLHGGSGIRAGWSAGAGGDDPQTVEQLRRTLARLERTLASGQVIQADGRELGRTVSRQMAAAL